MRSPLISLLSLGLAAGAVAAPEPDPVYDVRSGQDLVETSRLRLDGDVFTPTGLVAVGTHFWVAAYSVLESAGGGKPAKGQAYLFEYNSYGERQRELAVGGRGRFQPRGLSSDGDRLWLALAGSDPDDGSVVYSVRLRGHRVRRVFKSPDPLGCLVADGARRVLHAFPVGGDYRQMLSYTGRVLEEVPNPDGLLEYADGSLLADGNLVLAGTARTPVLVDGEEREGRLGGLAIQSIRGHLVRTASLLARDERGLLLAAGGFHLAQGPGGPRLHFVSGRAVADVVTFAPVGHEVPHGPVVLGEAWSKVAAGEEEDSKEEETP